MNARTSAIVATGTRPSRQVDWPQTGDRPSYVSEIYGQNVFTLTQMSKTLPKPMFKEFVNQLQGRQPIDKTVADAVAHAVRVWAMDR